MPFASTSSCPFAEQRHFVLSAAPPLLHRETALPVPYRERATDHHRIIFYAHKVSRYASLFSAITAEETKLSAVTQQQQQQQEKELKKLGRKALVQEQVKKLQQEKLLELQRSENSSPETNEGGGAALVLLRSNKGSDVTETPPTSGSNSPAS
ncbi:MAG: hypothetical protein Q9210_006655, partial [Variospora velana]